MSTDIDSILILVLAYVLVVAIVVCWDWYCIGIRGLMVLGSVLVLVVCW